MNRFASFLAAALLVAAPAFAATPQPAPAKADAAALTEGEVRKVDKEAGKVTIKHGPIANLEMPSMTMVFRMKEPGMLDRIKVGDRIRFRAEKIGGNYTVTEVRSGK